MRRPLNVLFAIASLAGGGSERQLITLLKHLDRTRIRPSLYLLQRSGEFLSDVPDDVPVIASDAASSPVGFYFPGREYRRQMRHLEQTLRDGPYDVLYDRTILMACVAGPAARRAGVPRIATVVADPERDVRQSFRRFRWLKRRILRDGYREAASVVANSDALRREVVAHYQLPEQKTHFIPNGFDFSTINRLAAAEPAVTLEPQRFHIAAMGRFQPQKGFVDLLRAVRHLVVEKGRTDLVLWLVGSGPEEPLYRRIIAEEPALTEHVRLPGFLTNPFALLSRVRLFCLSSRYEGSPNALVEAMACGTPVVSTNCPFGPEEILEAGRYGGLVPAGDWHALADAIDHLLADPTPACLTAELANVSIKARFDARTTTRQLEELLEAVCLRSEIVG